MKREKEKKLLTPLRKLLICYFALLILLLIVMGVFGLFGCTPLDVGLEYALFGLLVCSAMAAGLALLCRHLKRRAIKIAVGVVGALLILAAAFVQLTAYSLIVFYSAQDAYTALSSPAGETVVIMRRFNLDESLISERAKLRCADDPDADPDEVVFEDLGYVYTAYPRVARFFYRASAETGGSVEIAAGSSATLKYEWLDDYTLHLYVDGAEAYDFGEQTLKLN